MPIIVIQYCTLKYREWTERWKPIIVIQYWTLKYREWTERWIPIIVIQYWTLKYREWTERWMTIILIQYCILKETSQRIYCRSHVIIILIMFTSAQHKQYHDSAMGGCFDGIDKETKTAGATVILFWLSHSFPKYGALWKETARLLVELLLILSPAYSHTDCDHFWQMGTVSILVVLSCYLSKIYTVLFLPRNPSNNKDWENVMSPSLVKWSNKRG